MDNVPTREQSEASAMADGLRKLADLIETNPTLASPLSYALRHMAAPIGSDEQPRSVIAEVSRATLTAGGKVDKYYSDGSTKSYAGILAAFGPVRVQVYADRADVCERVVVGTAEVTKQVPDPDALANIPTVTVTETVEQIEWRCKPLLATT